MTDDKPKPSTASIFANAQRTAKNHTAGRAGAHTTTLMCQSCGAPRRDGEESLVCTFCGGHMTRPKTDGEPSQ
ncbi:MAG: hypothetical protein JKY37_10610 [Nannocystaceae bacterium]|nr:hypothetical protein [Nannocystaceae bacterium]